jgi:hypothetical protein
VQIIPFEFNILWNVPIFLNGTIASNFDELINVYRDRRTGYLKDMLKILEDFKVSFAEDNDNTFKKITKRFLNSFHGRTLKKVEGVETSVTKEYNNIFVETEGIFLNTRKKVTNTQLSDNWIGNHIAANAYYILFNEINKCQVKSYYEKIPIEERTGDIFYGDTDSFLFKRSRYLDELYNFNLTNEIGYFNFDTSEFYVTMGVKAKCNAVIIFSAKNYMLANVEQDGDKKRFYLEDFHSKGMPLKIVSNTFFKQVGLRYEINMEEIAKVFKNDDLKEYSITFDRINKLVDKNDYSRKVFENLSITKKFTPKKLGYNLNKKITLDFSCGKFEHGVMMTHSPCQHCHMCKKFVEECGEFIKNFDEDYSTFY